MTEYTLGNGIVSIVDAEGNEVAELGETEGFDMKVSFDVEESDIRNLQEFVTRSSLDAIDAAAQNLANDVDEELLRIAENNEEADELVEPPSYTANIPDGCYAIVHWIDGEKRIRDVSIHCMECNNLILRVSDLHLIKQSTLDLLQITCCQPVEEESDEPIRQIKV